MALDRKADYDDGFRIDYKTGGGKIKVAAKGSSGLLYAAFELLRIQAAGSGLPVAEIKTNPAFKYRILSPLSFSQASIRLPGSMPVPWHWDEINADKGTMSLNQSEALTEYARYCASVGINGLVVDDAESRGDMLPDDYLKKAAVMARLFRRYAIRLYLTIRVNADKAIIKPDGSTADVGDIERLWRSKVKEAYFKVPDLGGFVVGAYTKPNSFAAPAYPGERILEDLLASVIRQQGGIAISGNAIAGGATALMTAHREDVHTDIHRPREGENLIIMTGERIATATISPSSVKGVADNVKATLVVPVASGCNMARITGAMLGGAGSVADSSSLVLGNHFDATLRQRAVVYAFGRMAWNPDLPVSAIADEWKKCIAADTPAASKDPFFGNGDIIWGNPVY